MIRNSIYTGIISLIFFCIQAEGQWNYGVKMGVEKNYLVTNNSAQTFTVYKSGTGITLGFPILFQVNEWLALQSEIDFGQKNYQVERTGFFEGVYQKNINSYLQLPILTNLSFGTKKIRDIINSGLYVAYWMHSRIKGEEPNILDISDTTTQNPNSIVNVDNTYSYNQRYRFNTTKDKRLELGWIIGTGFSYEIKNWYKLFFEVRYACALSDQQKNYQINQVSRYNEGYSIDVGAIFKFLK